MFELSLDKIFQPADLGSASANGFEVVVYGYVLDDHIIALAFGESPTRCKAVWSAFMQGEQIELSIGDRRLRKVRREPGTGLYETFEGSLPDVQGHVTLVIHRAALAAYLAEPPQGREGDPFDHFYTFGPPGGDAPYPIWLAQLRQCLLLPAQPGWAETLWPEVLAADLATPLEDVAGFTPMWRVQTDDDAWKALYSHMAAAGHLAIPSANPNTYDQAWTSPAATEVRWEIPRRAGVGR